MLQWRAMEVYPSLVSDSALVEETIRMVRHSGGRAPASEIACAVLNLPDLDSDVAALLVGDLIRDDWRLRLSNGSEV